MNVDKIKWTHQTKEQIKQTNESLAIVEWVPKIRSYKYYPEPNVPIERKRWIEYRNEVRRLTEEVAHQLKGIELRAFRGHHIDHKISIWYGFKNGIPAERIADLKNLRIITSKENMAKGTRCLLINNGTG